MQRRSRVSLFSCWCHFPPHLPAACCVHVRHYACGMSSKSFAFGRQNHLFVREFTASGHPLSSAADPQLTFCREAPERHRNCSGCLKHGYHRGRSLTASADCVLCGFFGASLRGRAWPWHLLAVCLRLARIARLPGIGATSPMVAAMLMPSRQKFMLFVTKDCRPRLSKADKA